MGIQCVCMYIHIIYTYVYIYSFFYVGEGILCWIWPWSHVGRPPVLSPHDLSRATTPFPLPYLQSPNGWMRNGLKLLLLVCFHAVWFIRVTYRAPFQYREIIGRGVRGVMYYTAVKRHSLYPPNTFSHFFILYAGVQELISSITKIRQ